MPSAKIPGAGTGLRKAAFGPSGTGRSYANDSCPPRQKSSYIVTERDEKGRPKKMVVVVTEGDDIG